MELEQLGLLEQRVERLIQQYGRLKEEKTLLERSLAERDERVRALEREVDGLRQERDIIRERLARLIETIERLEALEASGPGGSA